MIGISSVAYSSIFIASPVLTHWKEREGVYRNRRARIERDLGYVPAYALATGEGPVDVEPPPKKRRGGPTLSEEPGDQLSREEFKELVRDIEPEVSERAPTTSTSPRGTGLAAPAGLRRGRSNGAPEPDIEPESPAERPQRDSSADLEPEDLVMKESPKQRRARRPKNRRHGRAR
jgi:SecD/SecF fusion protein